MALPTSKGDAMSVTLRKHKFAAIDHQGIIYRGPILRLNSAYVTIRVSKAHGAHTGHDYSDLVGGQATFVRDLDQVILYS